MGVASRFVFKERPESGALAIRSIDLGDPKGTDVLVRIHSASICGTDLHIYRWNDWAARTYRPPLPLGHEFGGVVVAVGPSVTGIGPGDHVTAETHIACERCYQCRLNRRHTCDNLQLFSRLGLGCFSDYAIVPAAAIRIVPRDIPIELATLMEPLGISIRAITEARVAGQRVLVLGAGPIGLFAVLAARAHGAAEIVATELSPSRRELALQVGADVSGAPDLLAERAQVFDAVIDTTGQVAPVCAALDHIRSGGRMVFAGLYDELLPLDVTRHVVLREISLSGVYGRKLDETWIATERLLRTHASTVASVVTDRLLLADFDRAFEQALSGKGGKIVLIPAH
jgi:threonine 3-dehydrogenase